MENRRMLPCDAAPIECTSLRGGSLYLIISTETREMPRAFVPFYLLGPLYVCAFRLVLPVEWDVPRWKHR